MNVNDFSFFFTNTDQVSNCFPVTQLLVNRLITIVYIYGQSQVPLYMVKYLFPIQIDVQLRYFSFGTDAHRVGKTVHFCLLWQTCTYLLYSTFFFHWWIFRRRHGVTKVIKIKRNTSSIQYHNIIGNISSRLQYCIWFLVTNNRVF